MDIDYKKRGAVSVFLLIIFLALLMLAGLMVDICRVMAAERKVQNALDSAVRSVLAGYDEELVGQFGLFGVAAGIQEEELYRYFRVNLLERHKHFNFINFTIKNTQITAHSQQSFCNDEVFKEQILAYMQYKGPFLLTNNVIEVFSQGFFEKKAGLLKTGLQASRDFKSIERAKKELNKGLEQLTSRAVSSSEKVEIIGNLQNKVEELVTLIKQAEEKVKLANTQISDIQKEVNLLITGEEQRQSNLSGFENTEDLERLKTDLSKILADLQYNQSLYERIASLEKRVKNLAIDDERRINLTYQIAQLKKQVRPVKRLNLEKIPEQVPVSQEEITKKESLQKQLALLRNREIPGDDPDNYLPEQEDISSGLEVDKKIRRLSGDNDYAEEIGADIFAYLKELTQGIQQIVRSGKEKTYLTEYIMDKFTFVTSPVSRGHYFPKGEVEYILCGHASEITNISEVCQRVWRMRFAFNVVDAFLFSPLPSFGARLGSALVQGFIRATADMIALYRGDSVPVGKGGGELAANLSYSDHLRILLLLQNEKTQLERMRQLMQINIKQSKPDFALKDHFTQITGSAEVAMDLWFAPLLQLDKLGFAQIQGNKYQLRQTSTQGY